MTNKMLKELMDLPLTDFGNALRLQAIFGKRWVYLPRFKSWMYRDQYNWKGKAFRHLAQDIDRLPMPRAEWEREERTDTIFWLMLSQRPTHVKNAVKMYRDMQLAEEAVRDEVLRDN